MHIEDFLHVVKKYQSLGRAVQDQLERLLDNDYEPNSLNRSAVEMIRKFGNEMEYHDYKVAHEILAAVEDYDKACEGE